MLCDWHLHGCGANRWSWAVHQFPYFLRKDCCLSQRRHHILVTTQREVWPLQPLPRPMLSYTGFILYKSCAHNHNCCRSMFTAYGIPPCLLTHFLPRLLRCSLTLEMEEFLPGGNLSRMPQVPDATATSPLWPLWWTVASHCGTHKYFLKLLLLGYPIPATKQVTKKPLFKTNYLLQLTFESDQRRKLWGLFVYLGRVFPDQNSLGVV